jgi:putative exosortase-associated protein (TIGR04073 family)
VPKFMWKSILAALVLFANQALATEEASYGDMVRTKLASGLTNMCFGIAEMPKNIINTSNQVNALFGVTGGVLKGTLHTMGRLLSGGLDFITFLVPSQPIPHPTYVWQEFKTDTTYSPFFDMNRTPRTAKPAAAPAPPATTGSTRSP